MAPFTAARRIGLTAAVLLLGCRGPTPAPSVAPKPAPITAPKVEGEAVTPPAVEAADITVRISPRLDPQPHARVELRFTGAPESLTTLRMPGPVGAPLQQVELRDAEGPVKHSRVTDDSGAVVLTLERVVSPPLTLAYSLAPSPPRMGQTARLWLSKGGMFATGEALLLLPTATRTTRQALHVTVDPSGLEVERTEDDAAPPGPLHALTTFDDRAEVSLEGLPYELHRAGYAAGYLEHARFDARGGTDRFVAIGSPSYDTRWISAEIAGLRTEIDHYVQQSFGGHYVTMLAAGPRIPALPRHTAELRGRGLVLSADATADWNAHARLSVATTLIQRWIGGRIRIVEGKDSPPSRAWALWFHGGVSRFVARELLLRLGLLTPEEYRDEVNAIELELATSPLATATLTELVERVDAPDPRTALDARALLVARGAIYATWIDARLREGPASENLGDVLGMLIAVAVVDGQSTFTLGTWLSHMRDWLDTSESRADYERVIEQGARPKLRTNALGPCFVPRSASLRRFDLGLVDVTKDGTAGVALVDPRGPAARAGLRADDSIVGLRYIEGDATTKAEVTVRRDGSETIISYTPAGPPARGIRWERRRGVADEQCAR